MIDKMQIEETQEFEIYEAMNEINEELFFEHFDHDYDEKFVPDYDFYDAGDSDF